MKCYKKLFLVVALLSTGQTYAKENPWSDRIKCTYMHQNHVVGDGSRGTSGVFELKNNGYVDSFSKITISTSTNDPNVFDQLDLKYYLTDGSLAYDPADGLMEADSDSLVVHGKIKHFENGVETFSAPLYSIGHSEDLEMNLSGKRTPVLCVLSATLRESRIGT